MTDRVLTESDALALGTLVQAVREGKRVAWHVEGDWVIVGVARHIVKDDSFAFLPADRDIRDGFLRVSGTFEHLLSVEDQVLPWLKTGRFVINPTE